MTTQSSGRMRGSPAVAKLEQEQEQQGGYLHRHDPQQSAPEPATLRGSRAGGVRHGGRYRDATGWAARNSDAGRTPKASRPTTATTTPAM